MADPFAFAEGVVCGVDALVARTGYTGEPGVELIVDAGDAVELWDGLLSAGAEPIGLGARDTLRLEMCYPLYGNDLTDQHTALEAGLGWACALDAKEFTGAEALREQRDAGDYSRLVPFTITGRGIPRPGMAVIGGGEVTSGTMSPSLEIGIGMAYLPHAARRRWQRDRDRRARPRGAGDRRQEAALYKGDREHDRRRCTPTICATTKLTTGSTSTARSPPSVSPGMRRTLWVRSCT